MRGGSPTFSIVMPAFNAERTIGPAIRSALAQDRGDFELIVVDDGSTDGTAELIRSFAGDPRVVAIRSANNGPAGARNLALARASGRFVSLLDSDDLYLPSYLGEVEEALRRNPDAGFAFPDAWVLDDRSGRIRRRYTLADYASPAADAASWLRQLLAYNVVHCMAMIPHNVLARVGPFDERLRAAMDYEFWLRIAAHGYRAVRISQPLGVYRVTPRSITSQRGLVNANLAELYRIVAEEYDVDEDVQELARRRQREVEVLRDAVSGGTSWEARRQRFSTRLRRPFGAARRRLSQRRMWYSSPPAELREFLSAMGAS
jgi:glycosyltransferase involved in cell wall biosynthesis